MGLGRSVGFTDGVRRALGGEKDDAEDFDAQLAELLGWFQGTSPTGVHARRRRGLTVPPFVLAMGEGRPSPPERACRWSSGTCATGTGCAAASTATAPGSASEWSREPYVVVSGTVAVAATPEAARRLLVPEAWSMAHARTSRPLPPCRCRRPRRSRPGR